MVFVTRQFAKCALLFMGVGGSTLAFAGVSVSSPTNGATVSSPVRVVASASSGKPITAMRIYVDGYSAYTTYSNRIDTSVAMSKGWHSVIVQAWDSSGAYFKAPLNVNVSGTSSSTTPTTSGGGYWNIDQMSGWGSCDRCAGIGANGPSAPHWMGWTSNPSLDGKSAVFTIGGSNPWANAIWWKSFRGDDSKKHFVYEMYFYIKNPSASQALEFDVNQSAGYRRYIYGTQCGVNYDYQWDVWDTAGNTWRKTGIPCSVKAYAWNHYVAEFARSNGQIHFIAITLNGKKSYVNRSYWSKQWGASEISVAVQLDMRGVPVTYSLWVDKLSLRFW